MYNYIILEENFYCFYFGGIGSFIRIYLPSSSGSLTTICSEKSIQLLQLLAFGARAKENMNDTYKRVACYGTPVLVVLGFKLLEDKSGS